jgi:hypothetical protein
MMMQPHYDVFRSLLWRWIGHNVPRLETVCEICSRRTSCDHGCIRLDVRDPVHSVEAGLAAADRCEFVEHEDVGKRMDHRYSS